MGELPDTSKDFADLKFAELPDYSKLFDDLKLPEVPDYSNLFGDLKLPELPDYSKLFGDLKLPELPDYSKLFGDLKLPELPDYSKLLGDLKLPERPDYSRLLGAAYLPTSPGGKESTDLHSLVDSVANASEQKLRGEIAKLQKEATEHAKALAAARKGSVEQKREIEGLVTVNERLKERLRFGFLLERVHPDAHQHLHRSEEFRDRFLATGKCSAFVLSIDIRRSTELMLKARSAEEFASFLTRLSRELTDIVLNSLGVFDKFTGDGILAFFPEFFSGRDAAFRVVRAADLCHAAFERLYRESRPLFKRCLPTWGWV